MPTRLRRWRQQITVLVAAAVLLVGCHPSSPPLALTPKEQAFMNTYTAHMVTHCFGRYLIDLPADMQVGKMASAIFAVFPYSEYSGGINVKVTPMTQTTFEHALEERKAKLKSMHIDGKPQEPYLDKVIPLDDHSGVVFNRSENGGSRGARMLELHGWKNGYAIKMTIKANDVSYPEYKADKQLQELGSTVKPKLAILQALYARTAGRPSGEIPTQPGTCIQNGFISGPASDKMSESISIDFVSKSMPDVNFTLQSNSGIRGTTTLLERLPDIEASLKAAKGHFIRKGHHTNPKGMSYDEILMAAITPNDHVMGQYFTLEANSKKGSAETPLLNVDFFNGDREDPSAPAEDDLMRIQPPKLSPLSKASLSEAEAVDLWDKTTATLRPRPGAF
jgi:hypothetical protein